MPKVTECPANMEILTPTQPVTYMAGIGLSPMTYVCGLESFNLQSKPAKLGIKKNIGFLKKKPMFFSGLRKKPMFLLFAPPQKKSIKCSRYIYMFHAFLDLPVCKLC